MEELVQALQAAAQPVDGVQMVPLATALQALTVAETFISLDKLQQALADLNLPLEDELPENFE